MKKFLSLSLALVTALSLVACSSSSSTTDTTDTTGTTGTDSDSGTVTPEYVLKFGDSVAAEHPETYAELWFAERVYELTEGKVQVEVYSNSALGSHADMVEGLTLGTVEITKAMSTNCAVYAPEIQIFDLPYMFQSAEHLCAVLDSDIADYYAQDLLAPFDLVGIGWFYAGSRSFYMAEPVYDLSDMAGRKVRVPESAIFLGLCDAFGCAGTAMGLDEIYTSVQTGVVDGAENAPVLYQSMGHYEAAPYFIVTEHVMTPDIILMSKSFLESMPQEYQDAIWQAMEECMQIEREFWAETDAVAIAELEAAGATFIEVDKTEWIEAAQVVWEDFADIVGQDNIDAIQAMA